MPFESKFDMKFEIVNELIVLIIASILFLFTGEFVGDEQRLGIGVALITIAVILFFINMVPVIILIK